MLDKTARRFGRPRDLDADNGSAPVNLDFARALLKGLAAEQKSIPCRFLYDARGSELFDEITRLPEYYPTRTETAILRRCAAAIGARTPAGSALVEFGSGSSEKTEILLSALKDLAAYVPIDISTAALRAAAGRLHERFPSLTILPLAGDFSRPLELPEAIADRPLLGFFPGSTIGNLEPAAAIGLLANMRTLLGRTGRLIIGVDLVKDERDLIAAYNDSAGITAEFNLNLLAHANCALGANFDLTGFRHEATWDAAYHRIDMWLVSQAAQTVRVLGHEFTFAKGDRIHTEHSHKYAIVGFERLAAAAGWSTADVWTDAGQLFSVHELT